MTTEGGVRRTRDPLRDQCPVRAALDVIQGRWKPSILFELRNGPRRFSELEAALADASAQVITRQLRELESDGVIDRRVHDDAPVRVEYALTTFGETLSDVMHRLEAWGAAYLERTASEQPERRDPLTRE